MANCKSKKPPFINQVAGHFADNELYSDIILRFSGVELPAHRIVLASQSGWFAQKLLEINRPQQVRLVAARADTYPKTAPHHDAVFVPPQHR